ncbi:MAG: acetyl-CoA acetyltransferase [bacterium]|nr:MAG: acetyl-CoA acetyltransferase [bacterium]
MVRVAVLDGVRTPQGVLGGVLRSVTAHKLGEIAARGVIEKTGIDVEKIDEVIFGCVGQFSDAPNVARVISLNSGIPVSKIAHTVQRNCASAMQAVVDAARIIKLGEAEVILAGGAESMSSAPYVNRDMRFGKRLRNSEFIDTLWEGLTDPVCKMVMGFTAENLAQEFKISREDQDRFAVRSHQKAFRATREGKFKEEIVPVTVPKKAAGKDVEPDIVTEDEGINPALNERMLASYPLIFKKDGSVTPGNSCGINDGAAAMILTTEDNAKKLGAEPLGCVVSYGFAGVEPHRMGIGPAKAVPIALERAGWKLEDVELIELNEAFAAQSLAVGQVLGWDWDRVNVNGGAIALGHPVGATGARIIITLLNEMKRRGLKKGLATLCIGGGQGGAVCVERA